MENEKYIPPSDERIKDALFVLKDICENTDCDNCMFAVGGSCKLDESPSDWNIRDNPNVKQFLM